MGLWGPSESEVNRKWNARDLQVQEIPLNHLDSIHLKFSHIIPLKITGIYVTAHTTY